MRITSLAIPGVAGASATIAAGSVTMLANGATPTVSNSGTSSAAVFNFGIPAPLNGTNGSNGTNAANPAITVSASGLSAGSSPTAVLTGSYPNLNIAFGIPAGSNGSNGSNGSAATIAVGTVTALASGYTPTIANSGTPSAAVFNFGIRAGETGSNASATPLGNATPLAAGTASAGASTSAARDDHRHPLQAGTLTNLGNVTISETLLISLALGIQRKTATLSGVAVGDKLLFAPNGVPTAGCEAVNVYASATNQVTVSCFLPALGIGATYSIPVTVYKVS